MESQKRQEPLIDTDNLQRERDLKLSAKDIETLNKVPKPNEFSFWVNDRMIKCLDVVTYWAQNNPEHEISAELKQLCLTINDAVLMDARLRTKVEELVREMLISSVLNIRTPLGRNCR